VEREDLLKKLEEIQEPSLVHLAVLNTAFLQVMDTIEQVRKLHKLVIEDNAACGDIDCCGEYEEWELCADCYCEYPCPTIKILDGDTNDV